MNKPSNIYFVLALAKEYNLKVMVYGEGRVKLKERVKSNQVAQRNQVIKGQREVEVLGVCAIIGNSIFVDEFGYFSDIGERLKGRVLEDPYININYEKASRNELKILGVKTTDAQEKKKARERVRDLWLIVNMREVGFDRDQIILGETGDKGAEVMLVGGLEGLNKLNKYLRNVHYSKLSEIPREAFKVRRRGNHAGKSIGLIV